MELISIAMYVDDAASACGGADAEARGEAPDLFCRWIQCAWLAGGCTVVYTRVQLHYMASLLGVLEYTYAVVAMVAVAIYLYLEVYG
jgi:hypothetical protein